MGRPLKIAKAQAILTLTDTAASGNVVTVSQNLTTYGVIAGMSFIPATTVGGLTGGTTYYVLTVLSTTTFTASATDLSANPTSTPVTLTDTSSQTVSLSVGLVDSGFLNPVNGSNTATGSETFGVVGGNSSLYGSQVRTQVAIGIAGTGTIYTSSANANVFGVGSNFTAQLSAGSTLQIAVANINGSTDYVNLGTVSGAIAGYANIEISNSTATGNFLTTVGNAQLLFANQPVILSANIGGLLGNTLYFVKTIVNAAAFTVSFDSGGGNVALANENATSYAVQDRVVLTGSASTTGQNAGFVYANDEQGYIVRQKGKTKYLVTGLTTGLTAQCYTANVANASLTPNSMSIVSTSAAPANTYIQSLNNYQSQVFPDQVAPGSLVTDTVYTIFTAGTTNWTSVGATANMTGITFTATGTASGTGFAILSNANPDVIGTFGTPEAANTYYTPSNPIVTILSA